MTRLSRSQIDKLGVRLRASERISDDDLAALQALRAAHDDAMAEVTVGLLDISVDGLALAPTSRLKTVGTLLDKLRRESIRLSQMQDIAGVRVVVDEGRPRQDRVVEAITDRFPRSKVVDRRENPSHGYRAVHVLVRHADCWVEVQVRTVHQDLWAQLMERLGDQWGRQIRYGEPPDDPESEVAPMSTRRDVITVLLRISEVIARSERASGLLEFIETTIGVDELPDEAERRVREATEAANARLKEVHQAMERLLVSLGEA